MIKFRYDQKNNLVIIEFSGKVDKAQVDNYFPEIKKIVPKCGKGFKLLADFTDVETIDFEIRETMKKVMDFFNEQGVAEILRVIPDPSQDIGLNIMSLFHYSPKVKILTLQSREEAEDRLKTS